MQIFDYFICQKYQLTLCGARESEGACLYELFWQTNVVSKKGQVSKSNLEELAVLNAVMRLEDIEIALGCVP